MLVVLRSLSSGSTRTSLWSVVIDNLQSASYTKRSSSWSHYCSSGDVVLVKTYGVLRLGFSKQRRMYGGDGESNIIIVIVTSILRISYSKPNSIEREESSFDWRCFSGRKMRSAQWNYRLLASAARTTCVKRITLLFTCEMFVNK